MRISDWISDLCSSDLDRHTFLAGCVQGTRGGFLPDPPRLYLRRSVSFHRPQLVSRSRGRLHCRQRFPLFASNQCLISCSPASKSSDTAWPIASWDSFPSQSCCSCMEPPLPRTSGATSSPSLPRLHIAIRTGVC